MMDELLRDNVKHYYGERLAGSGDLRATLPLLRVGAYGKASLGQAPLQIFDREGYGAEFFSQMVQADIPFANWEKHADAKRLEAIPDDAFWGEFGRSVV